MNILIIDHPRPVSPDHFNDVANAPLAASLNSGYAYAIAEASFGQAFYLNFYNSQFSGLEMAQQAFQQDPGCVLIHWVYNWDDGVLVTDLIVELRQLGFTGLIGTFGNFPTFNCLELLERVEGLDFVFAGEFEGAMQELFADLQNNCQATGADVDGIISKGATSLTRAPVIDLNQLPSPADLGQNALAPQLNIAASRGCYSNCSFCFIQPYYGRSQWRPRTVANLISELKQRLTGRSNRQVYFVDPNFFGPGQRGQKRAVQVADALKELNITFGIEARVNDIKSETIAALTKAGLQSVFLGLESGSPAMLERMRKQITLQQSEEALHILREHGLNIMIGFIMFTPDTCLTELGENYNFLEKNGLLTDHELTANLLYHNQIILKGTPYFKEMAKANQLIYDHKRPFEARPVFRHNEVDQLSQAMQNLTLTYFQQMNSYWNFPSANRPKKVTKSSSPPLLNHHKINDLLKSSFCNFLEIAQQGKTEKIRVELEKSEDELKSILMAS